MTDKEALEVINAKVEAAKTLIREAKELAQDRGISFEANIGAEVDGVQTDGSWVTSSYRC